MILLYDGRCGFCDRFVRFVLRRDRSASIRFAPLQGAFAQHVVREHPGLADLDSLVVVDEDERPARVSVRSDALVSVLEQMGGVWRAVATLIRILPRGTRDAAYSAFAKRRYRMFGRYAECRLPSADERARFID